METQPVPPSVKKLLPGRPMKYDSFIKALDLHELYSAHMAAKHGEKLGLFELEAFGGSGAFRKARNSLAGFCRLNLPEECDRVLETPGYKPAKSWYGWRWKRALSPSFFSVREWRKTEKAWRSHACRQALTTFTQRVKAKLRTQKLAIGLASLVVLAGAAVQHYRPVEAWRLLQKEGPASALHWLKDPHTPREKFMQAYSLYSIGDFEAASARVEPLMHLRVEAKTRGDAFYLAAEIARRSHSDSTLELYQNALTSYARIDAHNSLHLTYTSMAKHLIDLGDLSLALNHINFARTLPATRPNLGYFFEIESELYFNRGDHRQALNSSRLSLQHYDGQDISGTARMLSDVGFYHLLLGDLDEGLARTIASELIILDTGKMKLFYYNKINYLLHAKCSNLPYSPLARVIEAYAEKHGDRVLKSYLSFVETFSCGSLFNKGDGESPPPPPDGF